MLDYDTFVFSFHCLRSNCACSLSAYALTSLQVAVQRYVLAWLTTQTAVLYYAAAVGESFFPSRLGADDDPRFGCPY